MAGTIRLTPLTVGPIVGATETTSVRLWGRGDAVIPEGENRPRRCFGVARMRRVGTRRYGKAWLFKMNPNFDMTGLIVFDQLRANTLYEYQMGYFFREAEPEDLQDIVRFDWAGIEDPSGSFKTGSHRKTDARTFVFGSCRYLLRLFGGFWFEDRGDKTYRSIVRQLDAGVPLDLVLMVGDQIYADDLNVVLSDQRIDEYFKRYQEVFTQKYIRRMMSRLPTYMTLDDHEIEDNWPSEASQRDWMMKYPAAIQSYQAYQMSHSPLLQVEGRRITGVPEHFWYTFQNGCSDFFVMDCRTERDLDGSEVERQMIGDIQMECFLDWLNDGSGRVKFVVTSVPFFPDYRKTNEDKWSGFLYQRTQILDFIRDHKIERVVFLSGDVHCSMSAELVSPNHPELKVFSVISSSFFWPYPHAKRKQFVLSGALPAVGHRDYAVTNPSKVQSTDNFTRLTVDLNQLKVEVFARKGELLHDKTHTF